ncbi:hypothetical protein [Flavobacterium sp. XS2P39]|uniref:hypothetical protein n=1 Tax=Flavobacterium sp. XS2P39 TaxID=3401725 RepID=UPI003AABCD0C
MKKIILILFLIASVPDALSWPIPEQTLKSLIANSSYIVIGYVTKVEYTKHPVTSITLTRAKIKILKTFKGHSITKDIYVYFDSGMICPEPDNYEKHTKVLCFLEANRDTTVGGFFAPGLSYASKKITSDDAEKCYEKRINEFSKIVALNDRSNQDYEIAEWLVKCAENTLTRYDGTADLLKSFDYAKNRELTDYRKSLSKSQKERLFNCFISLDELTVQDYGLVALIDGIDDVKLLVHLKKLAHTVKAPDWLAGNPYIHWIATYSKKDYSEISKKLTENLGSRKYNTPENKKQMEQVYTDFLKLISENKE